MSTYAIMSEKHKPLFSEATLELGEVHQRLLQASEELEARSHHEENGRSIRTDFGQEVGKDEIHWWVNRKETDVDELRDKTEAVLASAQRLKDNSAILVRQYTSSYEKLVSMLAGFTEAHRDDIAALHEYVRWLHAQDPVAPAILFTYRVWGTTRRSMRWLHPNVQMVGALQQEARMILAEVVCGLLRNRGFTIDEVRREVESEIGDSLDPSQPAYYRPIRDPTDRVLLQTSYEALGSFAEYFEMIRDSLRNVILDVDKYKEQKDLLLSGAFWNRFIRAVKDLPTTEQPQWDFKEVLNMWRIPGGEAKARAKLHFAELVAGFANTKGGIIIVGITDQMPRQVLGIGKDLADIESRLKDTGQVIVDYLKYPRDIVRFHLAVVEDSEGVKQNCLIIAVAQACEPVAVMDKNHAYTYPIRVETGLTRVELGYVWREKVHLKSDSFDFVQIFDRMLHDK